MGSRPRRNFANNRRLTRKDLTVEVLADELELKRLRAQLQEARELLEAWLEVDEGRQLATATRTFLATAPGDGNG